MRNLSHKEIRRLLFLGASVLVFALYLIYSYNNIKGRSYIQEPIHISIEGHIPDKTSLELVYQTYNDPTIVQKAKLITRDSIPADTYVYRIDSSYRITNFIIYIQSLREGEEMSVSRITASIEGGKEFSFSLKRKDLIASENLELNQLSNGATSIKKAVE